MKSRKIEMEEIFDKLSERNKDIMILIAKTVKVTQDESIQLSNPTNKAG